MTEQLAITPEEATSILADFRAQVAAAASDQEAEVVAQQLSAWLQKIRARQWRGYPWQHPHEHPEGWVSQLVPGKEVCDDRCADLPQATIPTHGAWLQRGGRGTGKTEGAAKYINDHAMGPPCDPRVPGGHRFTIAAPTQADAVSSCVEGVSGLKAYNPAISITTGREGTIVRWPNGAQGRLLGGNTAKDVERARAWTNVCVAEGSLVATALGWFPIERITPGTLVWTRTGLRRVLHARATGVRPVVRITAPGADVWVTPDHPVALADGTFARADQITGKVLVWTKEESSTTESSGPDDQTATTSAAGGSCTGTSTPPRSGPSLPVTMSTTATTIRATTTQPTWWRSLRETTRWLIRRALSGTQLADALRQRLDPRQSAPAGSVGLPSPEAPQRRPAPRHARIAERRHAHQSDGCARCAELGSPAPSGTRPAPAPHPAEVSPPTRHAQVYDLAVEGHHEFYAGGLLVGNCVWWLEEAAAMPYLGGLFAERPELPQGMLDQAPFTLRLGSRPHMVITTTPKNRPEVIKMLSTPGPQTWGRTEDATRLDPAVRDSLENMFRGTTLGKQELDGDLIADTPGALWVADRPTEVDGQPNPDERPGIGNDRLRIEQVGWVTRPRPTGLGGTDSGEVREPEPGTDIIVSRVVVAIDPPGGRTECGIIVVGAHGQHAYILADLSTAAPPDRWARIALEAYYDFGAEGLAVEHAYGGNMVPEVIGSRAELIGVAPPPIFKVKTKVGKRLRAEPVQGLYQQHRVHHVGFLDGCESEQRTWVPDVTTDSPNRVDALVHGVTYLLIDAKPGAVSNPAGMPSRMPSTYRSSGVAGRRR